MLIFVNILNYLLSCVNFHAPTYNSSNVANDDLTTDDELTDVAMPVLVPAVPVQVLDVPVPVPVLDPVVCTLLRDYSTVQYNTVQWTWSVPGVLLCPPGVMVAADINKDVCNEMELSVTDVMMFAKSDGVTVLFTMCRDSSSVYLDITNSCEKVTDPEAMYLDTRNSSEKVTDSSHFINITDVLMSSTPSSMTSLELSVIASRSLPRTFPHHGPGMCEHSNVGAPCEFRKAYCRLPLMSLLRMSRTAASSQRVEPGLMATTFEYCQDNCEEENVLENGLILKL